MSFNQTYEQALAKKQAADARRRLKPRALRPPIRRHSSMKRSSKKIKSRGKPKPGSVRDLENQLDDLVRQILRREQAACFTCGTSGSPENPLQVSHLFTRTWRPTRFDVHPGGNNCMMCKRCNDRHESDPVPYRKAFIARHGKEALMEIGIRAQQGGKFDYVELLKMIEQRQAMLK